MLCLHCPISNYIATAAAIQNVTQWLQLKYLLIRPMYKSDCDVKMFVLLLCVCRLHTPRSW